MLMAVSGQLYVSSFDLSRGSSNGTHSWCVRVRHTDRSLLQTGLPCRPFGKRREMNARVTPLPQHYAIHEVGIPVTPILGVRQPRAIASSGGVATHRDQRKGEGALIARASSFEHAERGTGDTRGKECGMVWGGDGMCGRATKPPNRHA